MPGPVSRVRLIAVGSLVAGALAIPALPAGAQPPSFNCAKARAGSVPALVCQDAELSRLDRKLAEVYMVARVKAARQRPPTLVAEQRGWIKGRDGCLKSADARSCVSESYRRRTAELQARYQLVESRGPYHYACNGNQADAVVVSIFATDPPVILAERGDRSAVLYRTVAGDLIRYVGRNESFRETASAQALIQWGNGAPELRCTRVP